MANLGSFAIDDYVGIPAPVHRFSSGAAYAPTSLTYSIYEEATATGIDEDVDMVPASPFDAITGCYWVRRQLTAAAGFETGKNYLVIVKATADSVPAIAMHWFQIGAKVNATHIGGTAQTGRDIGASVLLSSGTGTGQISLSSGAVTAGTVSDKTGYSLAAASIQAIWDALTSALTTVGSIGKLLVDNINAAISSRATQTSVDTVDDFLDTEVAAIKAKTDNLPASPAATSDIPTAAAVADAIWDETRSGHVSAGTFGEGIASVQGSVTGSTASVTGAVGSVTTPVTIASSQIIAKKNVALSNFLFEMRDSSGNLVTGLTVTVNIIKDNGTPTASTNSVSEVGLGAYRISYIQAEMNADTWMMIATAIGAIPTTYTFLLQP